MAGEVSTRQWNDIMSVINRQKASLDFGYLRSWAKDLQVESLLARALVEAGIKE